MKSNYAKNKIKSSINKYVDQALDSFISDLSKKLDPFHKGSAIDIHKAKLKVAPGMPITWTVDVGPENLTNIRNVPAAHRKD